MKSKQLIMLLIIMANLCFAGGYGKMMGYKSDISTINDIVYELSDTQKSDLLFMYEEEKLAGDVYEKLYALWNEAIFDNISKAERMHMQSIQALLDKYGILYPTNEIGIFDNEELQSLYQTLLSQGAIDVTSALEVGKLIELTDIEDLEAKIIDATPDMQVVFQHLLDGSYSHLSAFEGTPNVPTTTPTMTKKAVKKGWSMLGFPIDQTTNLCDVLPHSASGSAIFIYDNGAWRYGKVTLIGDSLTSEANLTIEPMDAFWIYANEEFIIE